MTFFERSKVDLEFTLTSHTVGSGGFLQGTVVLTVNKAIRFACIGVRLKGEETSAVHYTQTDENKKKTKSLKDKRTRNIIETYVVLAGRHNDSGNNITFEPSTYTYPVSIPIPADLIPSYYVNNGSDYAFAEYDVKAYVDIRNGLDASKKLPIIIIHSIPAATLTHANAVPKTISNSLPTYGFSCCGACWFCCKRDHESLDISLSVSPAAVVFPRDALDSAARVLTGMKYIPNGNGSGPSANVAMRVRNNTTKPFKGLVLKLIQKVRITATSHSSIIQYSIGEPVRIMDKVLPGQEMTIHTTLYYPQSYRICKTINDKYPIPTLDTGMVSSSNLLSIQFLSHTVDFPAIPGLQTINGIVSYGQNQMISFDDTIQPTVELKYSTPATPLLETRSSTPESPTKEPINPNDL